MLENITCTKYLSVMPQHNAKFHQHIINAVVAKAKRTMGFLKCNLRIRATKIKAQAYKSLVRPIFDFEHSCTVWDPAAPKDMGRLEAKQCRAARYALNWHQRTASIKLMLQALDWPSLEHC